MRAFYAVIAFFCLDILHCWGDVPPQLFDRGYQLLEDANVQFDEICAETHLESTCEAAQRISHSESSQSDTDDWHILPDGLLWHSYLADPHEPRISTVIFHTEDDGVFWDATLGGRVGLLRYGTAGAKQPRGWQWDLEGAVITRLDILHAEDVESADFRFGTEITYAEGPWAMKFGYFHISSHVGDEYLIRNPGFTRVNYVTESWVLAGSYKPVVSVRLYGEFANAFRASGGAERYQFQTGAEYAPQSNSSNLVTPFAAIHFNFREAVDYDASATAQVGWMFQGLDSDRRLRFGLQVGDGPTSQYAFFQRRERYAGIGVWFDY